MVLEEASSPQEPTATYSENQPTSDIDPYSSNQTDYSSSPAFYRLDQPGAQQPIYIDLNNLPRPLAIFFQAQHSRNLANGINATCTYASKVLRRPLNQEEADAFAWHWAKSMRMASYGTPVGVSVAMLWAYRFKDYRFPGWKPMKEGSKLSPDKLGPFRGPTARLGWQVMRFNAYGFVGMFLGQLFFASYALTVHAAGRAMDPRLKEFTEALKNRQAEAMKAARETVREQGAQREGEAQRVGETYEMARQRRAVAQQQREDWMKRQRGKGRRQSEDDDMSPTGGSFEDDFMETGSDTGLMSDGQSREQQYRAEQATSTFDMSRDASDSSSKSTADTATQSTQVNQPQRQQSGSAWERLRQDAMSGNSSNPRRNTTSPRSTQTQSASSARPDDSFSFSQTEEDRQLARSEAQKEFDVRVEREREGKDFNDGSGSGRGRW